MDEGEEVRLVRKGKKRMAAPVEREADGGARGRDGERFRALWQDYDDLLKETEKKKKRLEGVNRRRLTLLAEVKFLRRKYDAFAKDSSQQTYHKLKKQAKRIPSPVGSNEASVSANDRATTEVPSTIKNTNFDLNQDSLMNDEGTDFRGLQDHPELKKLDQAGVDEDMMANDVNLSVCRDGGNTSACDDKRTIAWQDQVALKV